MAALRRSARGGFFRDLALPDPDISLNVGSGTPQLDGTRSRTRRAGTVRTRAGSGCRGRRRQLHHRVRPRCREGGLRGSPFRKWPTSKRPRSFDRTMPEEINRLLCDAIADFLFVTEESGVRHLTREGVEPSSIFFVATYDRYPAAADRSRRGVATWTRSARPSGATPWPRSIVRRRGLRPDVEALMQILAIVSALCDHLSVIRAHARGSRSCDCCSDTCNSANRCPTRVSQPWMKRASCSPTRAIQEETTASVCRSSPRENTERPVTVVAWNNRVIGTSRDDSDRVRPTCSAQSSLRTPPLWDGAASTRIVEILARHSPTAVVVSPVEHTCHPVSLSLLPSGSERAGHRSTNIAASGPQPDMTCTS